MRDFVFTSTSVFPGHPDKLCDRVSDAIVDAYLAHDTQAQVMAECAIASDVLFVVCLGTPDIPIDHAMIGRDVIREVGYQPPNIDPERIAVMVNLGRASEDIPSWSDGELPSRLVSSNNVTVFGYACNQTPDLLPAPIKLAHVIAQELSKITPSNAASLLPDGQVQVSVEFKDRKPIGLSGLTIIAGTGEAQLDESELRDRAIKIAQSCNLVPCDRSIDVLVNPTGAGLLGGPRRHPGLTGRKIAIDTYGDFSRHGSSALSGKNVTRIDRTGVYAARHAAKNVVAAGLADECEVQLSYSVGKVDPISIEIDTFGTGAAPDRDISRALKEVCDFRPGAIVQGFGLAHLPGRSGGKFFRKLAAFGHLGERDLELPWEQRNLVSALQDAIKP